jgi:dual specificity tyrosine-phosphorylation-regulated kinase 2/3/4
MQIPPTAVPPTSPPPSQSDTSKTDSSDYNPPSTSAHRKSSMLSLGIPSLLKSSSSRRSLQSDKEAAKDSVKSKDQERSKAEKQEKDRQKKEDKDRSESRISVLMGRKRGKVRFCTSLLIPSPTHHPRRCHQLNLVRPNSYRPRYHPCKYLHCPLQLRNVWPI